MPRLPMIEEKDHPELGDLIAKIRAGLQGRLPKVYRTMLHAPGLIGPWNEYMNAVRWRSGLDDRLREILIVRVAHLNKARYSMRQHVPNVALAAGMTLEECKALAEWRATTLFSARERVALAYADAMTRNVQVPDAVFEALRTYFDKRGLVELTLLIAAYNMQNRVVEALDVELEDPDPSSQAGSIKS